MAATYAEFYSVGTQNNGTLLQRIATACVFAAESVRTESAGTTNHTKRALWAQSVYTNPDAAARLMVWAMIGQNSSATLAQINAATDAAIQTNVNNAVDVVAGT